jgi:hypothetical protein
MLKNATCFFIIYICLVKSAIMIESENSAEDVSASETVNDISFGSLLDQVTDFITEHTDVNEEDENNGGDSNTFEIDIPNFDFEIPEATDGFNDNSYYYQDDDDDTFHYADQENWYFEIPDVETVGSGEVTSTSPSSPCPEEGNGEGQQDNIISIELPNWGSIFNSPPVTRNSDKPAVDNKAASHAASDESVTSAINSMFTTPHSDEYQNLAYSAMNEVRTSCKNDFDQICTPKSFPSLLGSSLFNLFSTSLFTPFVSQSPMVAMVPRARRLLQGEPVNRLSFLSKLKDHMEGVKHELSTGLKPKLDDMASKFAAFRHDGFPSHLKHLEVDSPGVQAKHAEVTKPQDAPVASPRDPPRVLPFNPSPSFHLLQGEMKPSGGLGLASTVKTAPQMLRGGNMKANTNRHLDRHLDEMKPSRHHDHDHNRGHQGGFWESPINDGDFDADIQNNHPWEESDDGYSGELLWGPIGDRCMYDNFDDLSQGCQDAISDIYIIREQYMDEEDDIHRGNMALFVFFVVTLLIVAFIKRKARFAKYEKDLAMYKAMQENPALKEQMEKASGVVMDKPKTCGGKSCGFFVLRVILSFLSALLALQFAFFVTILVVENNITYDQFGNEILPPPIVPFLTFIVSLLGATAMILCIHQQCFGKKSRRRQEPLEAEVQQERSTSGSSPSSSPQPDWNLPTFRMPNWLTRSTSNTRDYAVLPGESVHGNHGNEMVVITPSAPTPQAIVVQQSSYPSTAAVMTPVNII